MIAMGVKFLLEKEALVANPAEYEEDDESNLKGYVNTFRISNKTSFNELLTEACNFWVFIFEKRLRGTLIYFKGNQEFTRI